MGENFDDHRRIFDGGDDLQAAAAVGAVFDVDINVGLVTPYKPKN